MGCINSKDETETTRPQQPTTNYGENTVNNGHTATSGAAKSGAVSAQDIALELKGSNSGCFTDQYQLGKMIGSGTFSVVREATHKLKGQKYAIKCIKREGLNKDDIEALTTEVEILKQMDHPNIMILHDFFAEDKFYYLVTELMVGGELFDRIVEKSYYSEKEARDLVKLLLEAINYCHNLDVVHRDLKPENLLLTSKDDDASIKLADFGFAKKVQLDGEGLSTACGTPGYVAPEILQGKSYGKAVDIWSIGVITYILLCGYPPFHDDNHNNLFRKIKKGKFEFDSPYWDHVSADAKDLISKMLVVDPENRATAPDLLQHPWVAGNDVATIPLTSALEELRRFNARRKFKAAVNTVKAANILNRVLGLPKVPSEDEEEDTDALVLQPDQSEAVVNNVQENAEAVTASAPIDTSVVTSVVEVSNEKELTSEDMENKKASQSVTSAETPDTTTTADESTNN